MTDASPPLDPVSPTTAPSLVFEQEAAPHTVLDDVVGLVTGTFTVSLGLFLLELSVAVTGGTAGLSLLLSHAVAWPFWLLFAVVNLPFAALAVWKRGWGFALRTAVSVALVSAFSVVIDELFRVESIDPIFGTVAGNLLAGIGLLIVFRHGSSLGGINIVALIVHDATGIRVGWTMMVFDVIIILLALLVVPWPNVVMSAAGAVVLNLVLALNHRPGRYIGH
ncbi:MULTISPECIES: YitT family protein [unclassified Microbacterium]|uniref:YitT family protein n=1 Tax=unclassified Microbacterium TaxID=2609290 RepID=UPI00386A836C